MIDRLHFSYTYNTNRSRLHVSLPYIINCENLPKVGCPSRNSSSRWDLCPPNALTQKWIVNMRTNNVIERKNVKPPSIGWSPTIFSSPPLPTQMEYKSSARATKKKNWLGTQAN